MADIVFDDLRNMGQTLHILIIQPMTGIDTHPQLIGEFGRLGDGFELGIRFFGSFGVGIAAGMEFDEVSGELVGRPDVAEIGFDTATVARWRRDGVV